MSDDEWMTLSEAAAYLKIKPSTVRKWTKQGTLKGHKIGRVLRYSRREMEEVMRSA